MHLYAHRMQHQTDEGHTADGVPPGDAARTPRRGAVSSAFLVVAIGVVMQAGSALAVQVIDSVGVIEALWLRTFFAALVLVVARPRSLRLPATGHRLVLAGALASLSGGAHLTREKHDGRPHWRAARGPLGLGIERDLHWTPRTLREVRSDR